MPIGTPNSLGSGSANNTNTFLTFTVTANGSIGDHVFVFAGIDENRTVTSVTDSVGNTYAVDKTQANTTSQGGVGIASAKITNAIVSGSTTITANYSGSGGTDKTIAAATVSGLAQSSWADKSAGNFAATAAWSSSATATLSQADEIAWGCSANSRQVTATSAPDGGWTELFDFAGAADSRFTVVYQIVSATTALNASGTWSIADGWAAAIATYKMAATGAPPSGPPAVHLPFMR